MNIETKHRVVWKGNLWSDIVFTATSLDIPSSYFGLRVYLKLKRAGKAKDEFVPCSTMNFAGRPNFLFLSRNPSTVLGQSFTQDISSMCNFLFNNKCLVGVRVHHDILSDNFVSINLMILLATSPSESHLITCTNDEIIEQFRTETSKDTNLPLKDIDILSFQSDDVK